MDSYIEIALKPKAKTASNVLLNQVYTRLHKAIVVLKASNIGVSFPQYKVLLGKKCRIHSHQKTLNQLATLNWLGDVIDECHLSEITAVPENCQYRTISRIQSTMTNAKLRRLIKRRALNAEEIKQYQVTMLAKGLDHPYLELESGSNGHKYRRYLQFGPLQTEPVAGEFDTFGLSQTATIPWF